MIDDWPVLVHPAFDRTRAISSECRKYGVGWERSDNRYNSVITNYIGVFTGLFQKSEKKVQISPSSLYSLLYLRKYYLYSVVDDLQH